MPNRWRARASRSTPGQRDGPGPDGGEPGMGFAGGGEHQQVARPGEGRVVLAGPVVVCDESLRFAGVHPEVRQGAAHTVSVQVGPGK